MDLKLPGEENKKREIPFTRIAIWVFVAGVALYMIGTGLYGALTKGS